MTKGARRYRLVLYVIVTKEEIDHVADISTQASRKHDKWALKERRSEWLKRKTVPLKVQAELTSDVCVGRLLHDVTAAEHGRVNV